jgi:hypothetical protein
MVSQVAWTMAWVVITWWSGGRWGVWLKPDKKMNAIFAQTGSHSR